MMLSRLGLGLPKTSATAAIRIGNRNINSALFSQSVRANTFNAIKLQSGRYFSHSRYLQNTTKSSKDEQDNSLLVKQRGNRPISPHLTIYQPQLTWYLSTCHRISLVFMGFGFYLITILFGAAGLLGFSDFNSNKLIDWYHTKISTPTKWAIKGSFAYLFTLHYGLAIRHLVWDMAKELSLKGVYRTGYGAMAFAALAGTYLLSL
ncbi:hypothetical protein NCAS_0A04200 [Naumovozyma castellii]|uniref:Uncharacterized protein n=1 Tax=Naumovozyma castellii TaxID=27288 RepID=G0V686_NAUCA|nr:hypothetical protein NCAS_0A04200 [Naumovozyma castellii CBS 4309]CCC66978.1 hypothetical protein NCAS_0A04200 [Naumovozyma castellii CBS 4309]